MGVCGGCILDRIFSRLESGEGRAGGGGDERGAVFLLDEMAKGSGFFFFLNRVQGFWRGRRVAAQRPGVARWPGLRNLLCFADPNGWALQVFSDINIDLVVKFKISKLAYQIRILNI